ncbi:MAG TPA: GGDEF domain-containing protein [Lysobacter sp.]|nr:GGDEF domain-containing protein [Lysobacter sp.]
MRIGWLVLLLLAIPATAVAGMRVDDVLREQRAHGYLSAEQAVRRLQAADDRPGTDAPLSVRMRYQAAIAHLAVTSRQPAMESVADEALSLLARMARDENCGRCTTEKMLAEAQRALTRREADAAGRAIGEVEPRVSPDTPDLAYRLHFVRGRLYYVRGNFAAGIADMLQASETAERLGDEAGRVMAQAMLVAMTASLADHGRADEIGRRAYMDAKRMGFAYAMTYVRLNQAYNYSRSGRLALQAAALAEAYDLSRGKPGLDEFEAMSLSNLADNALQVEDYPRALDYARRAEALARRSGDRRSLSFALTNAGVATAHLGDTEAGLRLVRQALDLVSELDARGDIVGITAELVGIYKHAGRYREALEAFERVAALQRELTQQERDKSLIEMQERYASQARQREIDRLAAANRIKHAELAAKSFQQRMWLAVSLVLALAAAWLVRWLKRARRDNRRLSGDVAILAEQSLNDPLTGVANRRQCKALMARHTGQPGDPVPIGLVLVDVDFFKRVNDTWGHAAGDRVLVEIAARLRGVVRQNDTVVRWGGEEFALLLPGIGAEGLAALATRALSAIGGAPVDIGVARIDVTASVGAVVHPLDPESDWQHAMHVADLALYMSKSAGRNRATCLMAVAPQADVAGLGRDLSLAHERGEVRLEIIEGPHARAADAQPA